MPTLYRYYTESGRLLYVGITAVGSRRGSSHARIALWWRHVAFAEYDHLPTIRDVLLAERLVIWVEQPLFNVAGRVSTAQRQAMRAALFAEYSPELLIHPEDARRILGLSRHDLAAAVRWGLLTTDHPNAKWISFEALEAFIGEYDAGPATAKGMVPDDRHGLRPRFGRKLA